jgi:very-short-patch-repair endonuclease
MKSRLNVSISAPNARSLRRAGRARGPDITLLPILHGEVARSAGGVTWMSQQEPRLKYGLARILRKELTPPEARIWARLKGKPDGLHFRKQHPIGPYIVDFYCAQAKLVIEVEGQIHNVAEVAQRDERRTTWLEGQGYHVYRMNAADIMADPDEAAYGVYLLAKERVTTK